MCSPGQQQGQTKTRAPDLNLPSFCKPSLLKELSTELHVAGRLCHFTESQNLRCGKNFKYHLNSLNTYLASLNESTLHYACQVPRSSSSKETTSSMQTAQSAFRQPGNSSLRCLISFILILPVGDRKNIPTSISKNSLSDTSNSHSTPRVFSLP